MNKGGFSWKTFFGVTALKRKFSRKTGIPLSMSGFYGKVGRLTIKSLKKVTKLFVKAVITQR